MKNKLIFDDYLEYRINDVCDADRNSNMRILSLEALVLMGEILEMDDEVYTEGEGNVWYV